MGGWKKLNIIYQILHLLPSAMSECERREMWIKHALSAETKGTILSIGWSLNDNKACFEHQNGKTLSYRNLDGAEYLAGRELITRATRPGALGQVDGRGLLNLLRYCALPLVTEDPN
jgi:hypothetical protein